MNLDSGYWNLVLDPGTGSWCSWCTRPGAPGVPVLVIPRCTVPSTSAVHVAGTMDVHVHMSLLTVLRSPRCGGGTAVEHGGTCRRVDGHGG